MQDRRTFARLNLERTLKFWDPHSGVEGQARVVNISANGIGLITSERLLPKTDLEVWLEVPGENRYLHMRSRVIWSRPADDPSGQHRVGIQLYLDEEKLMDLGCILRIK